MIIDISKFFIISKSDLNIIFDNLGVTPITSIDGTYMATLILANIFAYLIIILFIYCLFKLKRRMFGDRRNYKW